MIADEINTLMVKAQNSSSEEICVILDMFSKWEHELTQALIVKKQDDELYARDDKEPYWQR